jgi:signal transduction histidine kinase
MTRQIKGTGLGLYLVREIVAAHGGTVKLESAGIGKGSTVTVVLKGVV